MPLQPDQTVLHFQVLAQIGEGGMGAVYRARDTKLDREVALKVLPPGSAGDPERDARFAREAKTLAALQHSNIASIYGFEDADGVRFLTMELVDGEDLAQRLARGALPVDETIRIARQIAMGLEAAHEKHIIHRDLKPANIKVGSDGAVKVLDFGLARAYSGKEMTPEELESSPTITSAMTQAGTILGTAAYMSPEQARGKALDRRADIWAFGVIVFEMLTGRRLFEGETISDTLAAVLREEPDWDTLPASTPPQLKALLQRCLQRDPRDRMRDAGDLQLELREIQNAPAGAGAAGSAAGSPGILRFVPWLVVVMLAAGLGWSLTRPSLTEAPPLEFDIHPPPHREIREFQISRDGTRLVFVATERYGSRNLWLRDLESAELRELPGTQGVTFPFWSPDARFVAFFAEEQLRRIEVATGAVQAIADAPNGRGGTWADGDRIIFTPAGGDVLYTVSAQGGTPQPLTQLGGDRSSHRFPHLAADGQRFTYSAHADALHDEEGQHRILADLEGTELAVLPPGMSESYATARYLLYVHQGNLVAHAFDPGRGAVSGEPQFLADKISSVFPRTGSASFSVSQNGVLAYLRSRDDPSHLAWYDDTGQMVAAGTPGTYLTPTLSPDGRSVIYRVGDSTTGQDVLWVYDLTRASSRQIRSGLDPLSEPSWSHDGRSAFYRADDKIWRLDLDGGQPELLIDRNDAPTPEALSSMGFTDEATGGRLLVFHAWDPSSDFDVWMLRGEEGAQPERVIHRPNMQWSPRLSPDAEWIAYLSRETGRNEVYVCRVRPNSTGRSVSSGGGRSPLWSEDGRTLYYVAPDFEVMAVDVRREGGELELGLPRGLFPAPAGPPLGDGENYFAWPELLGVRDGTFLFNAAVGEVRTRVIRVAVGWEERLGR